MKKQILLLLGSLIVCLATANGQTCTGSFSVAYNDNLCLGDSINIIIADTPQYGNYIIDRGNGSRDTTNLLNRTFPTGGLGPDTFIVYRYDSAKTCMDSLLVIFTVHKPQAGFSFIPDSACAGTQVNFTGTSTGTNLSYSWDFNDPSSADNVSNAENPGHAFNNAKGNGYTSYRPMLIVTDAYGCKDTARQYVYVKEKPNLGLSGNLKYCNASMSNQTFNAALINTTSSSVSQYILNWGDGSNPDTLTSWFQQNHQYDTVGEFFLIVTATGNNGCVAKDTLRVINETTPSVSLTNPSNASGCAPQSFTFYTSPANISPSTKFVWVFGSRDTIYWDYNDYLNNYDSANNRASIIYNFDTTSCGTSTQVGSVNYQNSFAVEIFVLNNCHPYIDTPAANASAGPIKICQVPVLKVDADTNKICINSNVTFYNNTPGNCEGSSSLTCNSTLYFLWDFGDGSSPVVQTTRSSIQHSYSSPGNYQVKLKVVTTDCGDDSIYYNIRVDSIPVAGFTYTTIPGPQCTPAIQFDDTGTGRNLTRVWTITPNSGFTYTAGSDTAKSPEVTFTEAGIYYILLTDSNACGSDTAQKEIIVLAKPRVEIDTIFSDCEPYQISPTANIDTNYSSITSYQWQFPAGSITGSSNFNPGTINYPNPGIYSVKFSATNTCGTSSDSIDFTVFANPVVSAGENDTFCANNADVVLSTNTPTGGYWLGPGITDSLTGNFSPDSAGAGSHQLVYVYTDTNGCTNSDTAEYLIYPVPVISAGTNDTICLNADTLVLSNFSPAGGVWSGAGIINQASGTFDPAIAGVGSNIVFYSYTNPSNGCNAIDSKYVYVDTIPAVDAGQDFEICENNPPLNLTGLPAGGNWSGNGITNTTSGTFSAAIAGVDTHKLIYSYTHPTTGCQNKDSLEVIIRHVPVADFSIDDSSQCLPGNSFGFTNNSSIASGSLSHKWYFGDGDSASTANPSHSYALADTFTVLLVSTSNYGCADTAQNEILVHPLPVVAFDFDTACLGTSTDFTNLSNISRGSITNYKWYFGDGDSSSSINPAHAYTSAGSYTVRLIAESAQGCIDSTSQLVDVGFIPSADFDAPPVCIGFTTIFSDSSTINGNSLSGSRWYFGDGDSSLQTNPTHNYATHDTFSVILVRESNFGCRDTAVKNVIVHPKPVVNFSVNDTGMCETGNSFSFTNTTTISGGNMSYFWDFGDNNTSTDTNAIHSYAAAGTYTVKLVVSSDLGCSDSATRTMYVHPMPVAAFDVDDSLQCLTGNEFSFTNNSAINAGTFTNQWNFGDGNGSAASNPVYSYSTSDTFTIKLLITSGFGCVDSAEKNVYTAPNPFADFSINDSSQCITGNSFSFTDQSTISIGSLSHKWYFGDGDSSSATNPTYSYSTADTFNVQLIVTGNYNCTDTQSSPVMVNPMPIAAFTVADSVQCFANNSFSFVNNSNISSGSISNLWVFGDGDSSTASNPVHSYQTSDTFLVKLYTESGFGCIDSAEMVVRTNAQLIAEFTVNDSAQCLRGNSYSFYNLSVNPNINHKWYFGDGDSADTDTATHIYSAAGTYTVKLFVTVDNCIDSFKRIITVNPTPLAAFTFDTACYGDTTYFTDETTISSGSISSYKWYFGDGDSSLQQNIGHIYAAADTYSVQLKVQSDQGCRDSTGKVVDVGHIPVAHFGATNVCLDSTTSFSDSSSIGGNSITGYKWFYGDGDSSLQQNPTHVYAGHDTFTVTLITESEFGCKDTTTQEVVVYPNPEVYFDINDSLQCLDGNSFIFTNQTTINSGTFTNLWTFGDGNGSNNLNDTHSYSTVGTYPVKLIATSGFGCTDSLSREVEVKPMPFADFSADTMYCAGSVVTYSNNSSGATEYLWVFGDGDSSTLQSPQHIFSDTGLFTTILYAKTGFSCADTAEFTIQVIDTPQAAIVLMPDSGCAPLTVFFSNNTIGFTDSFTWNLGNGTNSFARDPDSVIYLDGIHDTAYFVTLKAQNMCGSSTVTDTVIVIPRPRADFGFFPPYGCSPLDVLFNNRTTNLTQTYLWDFGDGTTSTKDQPYMHTFTTDTTTSIYNITLYANNICGTDSLTKNITITPNTVVAFFEADTLQGCAPLTVNIADYSRGSTTVSYNTSDGYSYNVPDFSHTFDSAGTYTIEQYANNGCSYDTVIRTFVVLPNPQFQFTVSDKITCEGALVTFTNTTPNSAGQTWYFGDGDSAFSTIAKHTYLAAGTYVVRMKGSSSVNGCKADVTDTILVREKPQTAFTPDIDYGCQPVEVQFTNTTPDAVFYTWDFDDGNTSGIENPVHIFADTGHYNVRLIAENAYGCVDTGYGLIRVFVVPVAAFAMSQPAGCEGQHFVNFFNNSTDANSYTWSFGNGESSTLKDPAANYSNVQTYTISLIAANNYGCSDTVTETYTVHPQPVADFDAFPKEGCQPLEVSFTNSSQNSIEYLWRFGNGDTSVQQNPTYLYRDPGNYTITLIAKNSDYCIDSSTQALVEVWPKPVADFTYTFVNVPQAHGLVQFNDASLGAAEHLWTFGDGGTSEMLNPQHRYQTPGNYTVTLYVESDKGCLDTAQQTIESLPYFHGLQVPNAFTPNSGPFDIRSWKPVGVWLQTYHVQVYNTWGELIWESDKLDSEGRPAEGWDGTWKGEPMPQDAYVWKINAIFRNGQAWPGQKDKHGLHKKMGTVTLIR